MGRERWQEVKVIFENETPRFHFRRTLGYASGSSVNPAFIFSEPGFEVGGGGLVQSCHNMLGWGIISETHTEPWPYLDGRHLSVASPAKVGELLEVVAKPHRSAFGRGSLFNLKLQMVEVRKIMVPPRSANTALMLTQRLMPRRSTYMLTAVVRSYRTSRILMLFRRNSTKRK